jgi:hypothetical protein
MRQFAAAYGSLGLSTQRQREVTDTVRTIQRLVNASDCVRCMVASFYGCLVTEHDSWFAPTHGDGSIGFLDIPRGRDCTTLYRGLCSCEGEGRYAVMPAEPTCGYNPNQVGVSMSWISLCTHSGAGCMATLEMKP